MGGKIRSYNILKQLAVRHEITLFTFYPEHPDDQHLDGNGFFAKIVAVPLPLPPRRSLGEYLRSARMMAARRPVTIDKFLSPAVSRRYAELLASATFDVVVCDFLVPGSLMHWKRDAAHHSVHAQRGSSGLGAPLQGDFQSGDESRLLAGIPRAGQRRAPLCPTGGPRSDCFGKRSRRVSYNTCPPAAFP